MAVSTRPPRSRPRALLGPLALKLMSTGYRFVRYYTHNAAYREKGPPHPALRGLAPVVVFLTLAVFATGIVLLALGPGSRDPWVLIHKVTFILWIGVTALHVLGHVPELLKLRPGSERGSRAGEAGRWLSLSSALVLGLVLAVVLIPDFAAWTQGHWHHH
jgi:hypothetical protein